MTPNQNKLAPVKWILIAQLAITFGLSSVMLPFGSIAALSALAGGSICVLANIYAAWRSFASFKGNDSAHGELANLYRAEVGKLVMIVALCAAVFAGWKDVHISAFIAGCFVTVVAGAIMAALQPLDDKPRPRGEKIESVE